MDEPEEKRERGCLFDFDLDSTHESLNSSKSLVCMAQNKSPATAKAIIMDPFVNKAMSYLLSAIDSIWLDSLKNYQRQK